MALHVITNPLPANSRDPKGGECSCLERVSVTLGGKWLEPPETFADYNRYFGMNVLRTRKQLNMTREFLAALSYMSEATIARIEQGATDPKLSSMCNISLALETALEDLLSAPPRPKL